ncbi:hypothetical protein [Bacillus toyonensis]|uniref:hypothetical protein n=1 Tax=Bacillus toyonensis TaxID=155322 RepID=UPI000BF1DEAC|nr:hypothetical protein [Bacillus toyonensis]KAB2380202.1 hypothetical protein F8507_27340 [Bacillus toyonensis]PEM64394.1 hypothetical protein CN625_01395 [Bacillus toyonensis]
MGIKEITELVKTEYVFGVLFILGLVYIGKYVRTVLESQAQDNKAFEGKVVEIYENQLTKAHDREDKLMAHQTEMTRQLEGISATQSRFAASLDKLEQRTEDNFRALWQEVQK